jgi:uncharacterized protein (TIGR02757 family)
MTKKELHEFLIEKAEQYENRSFILDDPIQIPHRFHTKQDIEIIGFFTALIAWGNRKSIIKSAELICEFMGNAPHEFILNHENTLAFEGKSGALHRTFMWEDFQILCKRLQAIYLKGESLESRFSKPINQFGLKEGLWKFKQELLGAYIVNRVQKHLPNPMKGSSAKRINMYLRWMVRSNERKVDFGIWKSIPTEILYIPLDVHTGNVAKVLGITTRKQNDWKTLEEIMEVANSVFPEDPSKLDFALFGLGAVEKFADFN